MMRFFFEYDRNFNFIPDNFLSDIVPRLANQESQRHFYVLILYEMELQII